MWQLMSGWQVIPYSFKYFLGVGSSQLPNPEMFGDFYCEVKLSFFCGRWGFGFCPLIFSTSWLILPFLGRPFSLKPLRNFGSAPRSAPVTDQFPKWKQHVETFIELNVASAGMGWIFEVELIENRPDSWYLILIYIISYICISYISNISYRSYIYIYQSNISYCIYIYV